MSGRRLPWPWVSPVLPWGAFTVLALVMMVVDIPTEAATNGRIAFLNVSMNSTLVIQGTNFSWDQSGTQLAFSFKTCSGGQLLYQNGSSGDFISLDLNSNGTLELRWRTGSVERSFTVGSSFIGKDFYYLKIVRTVLGVLELEVKQFGRSVLIVSLADSTNRTSVWSVNLGGSSGIQVGGHMTGCVMEGPGISFRNNSNVVATNVLWYDTHCPINSCNPVTDDGNQCYNLPCQNGGTCVDEFQAYSCQCAHLFNGTNCENNLSLHGCQVTPCLNGGTCEAINSTVESNNRNYKCICAAGFTDVNCQIDMDECNPNPCQHSGRCVDGVNSFTCICADSRFDGNLCQSDINECQTHVSICGPGTCYNTEGGYDCNCPTGYDSEKNCTQSINDCLGSPCQNGGTCVDGMNAYTCQCVTGFTGTACDTDIDNCLNAVCSGQNQICRDLVNAFDCICKPGYYGDPCVDFDECSEQPCTNGASCTDLENDFSCACVPGYTDKTCITNIDDCSPNPCRHGSSCQDGVNNYMCECIPGYTDQNCSRDINECQTNSQPCRNGATCRDEINRYECDCVPGWTGTNCEGDINECGPQPCQNGASCHDYINNYNCTCVTGFTGVNCSVNIDDCSSNPCANAGTCHDQVNGYRCECPPAWMGKTCTQTYDACSFEPCQNGATCNTTRPDHVYTCACILGYSGDKCQTNIDECAASPCQSPNVCFDHVNNYTCACPIGYTGPNCTTDINECIPDPCQNGATCQNKIGEYVCHCPGVFLNLTRFGNGEVLEFDTGYNGTNCEYSINECDYNPGVCLSDGSCEELDHGLPGYQCRCGRDSDGLYRTGQNCDLRTSYCETAEEVKRDLPACKHGGTCIPGTTSFTCNCVEGYTDWRCQTDIDECASNPCQYGGTCDDRVAGYNCTCIRGITGAYCEIDIDECESSPCHHGGRCNDSIDIYECDCYDTGFNGSNCELNIDDCASYPCLHGSTCNDGIKNYTCSCHPGYTGKNCEVDINECRSSPCLYNGTCLQRSNQTLYDSSYDLPGYTNFSANFSYDAAAGYACICIPGITGVNCSINIDDCEMDNCTNGATCRDQINAYSCQCAPGYKDIYCQTEIDECREYQPCHNGATCTDQIANYDCTCAKFYMGKQYAGKNCTFELTACNTNNCQNGATCDPYLKNELTGEQDYRCLCPNGFTGMQCERSTTGTFLNTSRYTVYLESNTSNTISFLFRTTLPDGILFVWNGGYQTTKMFVTIELVAGQINMTYITGNNLASASMSTVGIPIQFNDAEWHGVELTQALGMITWTVTSSLCPSASACTKAVIHAPNIAELEINFGRGKNEFQNAKTLSTTRFIGCIQDVTINGAIKLVHGQGSIDVPQGCLRTDQCHPDPCNSNGACTDLWSNYLCDCRRPHLGPICNQEYVAATFSFENTKSTASFTIPANLKSTLTSNIDLSLFMRTRQPNGLVVFFGFYGNPVSNQTFLTLEIHGGALVSRFVLCSFRTVLYSKNIVFNNGAQHFVRVRFHNGEYKMTVNHTEIDSTVINTAPSCPFNPDKLQFGGDNPDTSSSVGTGRARRSVDPAITAIINDVNNFENATSFKGTLQDAQLNQNSLQFIPPEDPSIVNINVISVEDNSTLTKGEQSDDICKLDIPCLNNATCSNVFFNDFSCACPHGFRGKDCGELDFCHEDSCPGGATCQSLNDGFECLSTTLFNPRTSSITYKAVVNSNKVINKLSLKIKTRVKNGVLLDIIYSNNFLKLGIVGGKVMVTCKFGDSAASDVIADHDVSDQQWYLVTIVNIDNVTLSVQSESGDVTHALTSRVLQNPNVTLSSLVTSGNGQNIKFGQDVSPQPLLYYRGCIKEVRLAGILLPFFEQSSFTNFTTQEYFEVVSMVSIPVGCVEGDRCLYQRCQNGAQCKAGYYDYQCTCPTGYEGRWCETNTPNCLQSSCLNNGVCVDTVDNFFCNCQPGYTGLRCDAAIDYCRVSPCQNNGSCANDTADYLCTCADNFTGKNCSIQKYQGCNSSSNGSSPCKNSALCTTINLTDTQGQTQDSFNCSCLTGYEDVACETAIDYCATPVCQNNATCISNTQAGNYTCTCLTGYTGDTCDTNIDDCADKCQNNGTCTDFVNDYACNCTQAWMGQHCNVDVNECSTQPCQNNASCNNSNGTFTCDCYGTGYQGANCSEDIDECLLTQDICQYDSHCTNSQGDYSCNCSYGYINKNCSKPDCGLVTCENNGTCETADVWTCECQQFYYGDRCHKSGPCLTNECNHGNCSQNVTVSPPSYTCDCNSGYNNKTCMDDIDECLSSPCQNGGGCQNTPGTYQCTCSSEYMGEHCVQRNPDYKKIDTGANLAVIIGPSVAAVLLLIIVGVIIFLVLARSKRATRGHYNPSRQEVTGSRVELGNVMKPPPEERLI